MAVIVPKGTAAIDMIITSIAVPNIAGKIPPLVMPSVGKVERNSQVNISLPPIIITTNITISIAIIISADISVIPSKIKPLASCLNFFTIISPVFFSLIYL